MLPSTSLRIRDTFYQTVVYPLFDLGDLSFCPDREAEQTWKDRFGKRGLLGPFLKGLEQSGDPERVAVKSSREYLRRSQSLLRNVRKRLPESRAKILQDALDYGWLDELQSNFLQGLEELR